MEVLPDFTEVRPNVVPEKIKEMLTVRTQGQQTIVRINSSSLSVILSCPRKSYYSLHRNLRSKSEGPALTFGTAIHKALEVFYSYPYELREFPVKFVEYSDLLVFGTEVPPEKDPEHFLYKAIRAFALAAAPLATLPDTDKHSLSCGAWMLQHYFKTYLKDPYEVYVDAQGPFVERTSEIVILDTPELKIIVFGTLDIVLKNLATGAVLPGDHKTTSQLGSDFFNRLKPNHQYTGYLMIAREVFGLQTNEFLVNGLQKKPRPLTTRGTPPNFSRQITTRSEQDFQEFKDAVLWAVRSYLEWSATNNWPIGNVDACTLWGGCQFLQTCSAPSQIRENIIQSSFNEVKQNG